MHMNWSDALDGMRLAAKHDSILTIGGGEPTMHPRFFDILKRALDDRGFEYVWLATNGTNKKSMMRLANIIEGCDYESFDQEDYCTCSADDLKNGYTCDCYPTGEIYQENKLGVALSQDHFHEQDKVSRWVVDHWTRKANGRIEGYEIRNVTQSYDGVVAQGRAKRTGSGWAETCVCADNIIRPDGKIKLCGCTSSPIIGDIRNGIDSKWNKKLRNSEHYQNEKCYKSFKRN